MSTSARALRSLLFLATMFAALAAAPARGAELFGTEQGLVWKVGTPERQDRAELLGKMDEVLARNPYISQVFLGGEWLHLEPESGRYDWAVLDAEVALAHQHHKQFKFSILPGEGTPAWVYAQGAAEFDTVVPNPHQPNFGAKVRIPLPWDGIYLAAWRRFLGQLAGRYANDRSFVAITLSGVNYLSTEMHLPKTQADQEHWQRYPDRGERIVETYRRLIDAYAQLFPHQELALHVSDLAPGLDQEVAEIVAYGAAKYPDRFTLQNCQLDGRKDNAAMLSYQFVLRYKDQLRHGFQTVGGWRSSGERQGSMEMTIFNLVRADGEYLEIFRGDGADPAICARVLERWQAARKTGWQAYEAELKREGKFVATGS